MQVHRISYVGAAAAAAAALSTPDGTYVVALVNIHSRR